jgi:ABC-type branched-subunit amino acid transport system substrate-binding protein
MSMRRMSATVRLSLSLLAALVLSACGGPGTPGSQQGTLDIGVLAPFTGPDADFGPTAMAGCYTAVSLINADGGVLGHKLRCVPSDTKGDPADAVPAAEQMIATHPGLVAVAGPTSDETTAVAPILNENHIPFFTSAGQAIFNRATWPYFYRLTPADDVAGYAMALWGHLQGYQRAAGIFGNDVGSQGTVPTLQRGLGKLGSPKLMINETVALDQTSYRSEVTRVLAAHPQVIFTEIDAQTAATFFSELKALGGLVPVIGADPTLDPTWFKTVAHVVGSGPLSRLFTAENPVGASSGPAYEVYAKTLVTAPPSVVPDARGYLTDGVAQSRYNGLNLVALAMLEAKSVNPSVFNRYIAKVAQPKPGAVKVYTFAQGKAALLIGKQIQYVGVGSGIFFDKHHNSPGQIEIDHFLPNSSVAKVPGSQGINAAQINSLAGGS